SILGDRVRATEQVCSVNTRPPPIEHFIQLLERSGSRADAAVPEARVGCRRMRGNQECLVAWLFRRHMWRSYTLWKMLRKRSTDANRCDPVDATGHRPQRGSIEPRAPPTRHTQYDHHARRAAPKSLAGTPCDSC